MQFRQELYYERTSLIDRRIPSLDILGSGLKSCIFMIYCGHAHKVLYFPTTDAAALT